jgi:hypothetical protein
MVLFRPTVRAPCLPSRQPVSPFGTAARPMLSQAAGRVVAAFGQRRSASRLRRRRMRTISHVKDGLFLTWGLVDALCIIFGFLGDRHPISRDQITAAAALQC